MARVARIPEPRLMGEMNVTPFIDVMLVLLIVMILSIPIATHKVPIDLPQGPSPTLPSNPHKLGIERAGTLLWDGKPIADAALPAALATMLEDPQAVLHVQADPEASYARFDETLAVVKRAGVTKLGFVGNESMRQAIE